MAVIIIKQEEQNIELPHVVISAQLNGFPKQKMVAMQYPIEVVPLHFFTLHREPTSPHQCKESHWSIG